MKVIFIAFLDLLFCMLMLVLVQVHPEQDPKDLLQPPGNLFVYTVWSDTVVGQDVDTWVLAPGMGKPIGYDHKDSPICNLVKDDLGVDIDSLGFNYENVFCRTAPDGEYVINVYAYTVTDYPMEVHVQVAMNIAGVTTLLFDEKVTLNNPKEEQTVIRFKLKDGKVVPGSVHHTFISLYGMK